MTEWVAVLHHTARGATVTIRVTADDEATAREYAQHQAHGFVIDTIDQA